MPCSQTSPLVTINIPLPIIPATPSLPRKISSTAYGDYAADLVITWDPVPGATIYEVQHKDDNVIVYRGPDTKCRIIGLASNSPYTIRIRACNNYGCSDWSQWVTLTTEPYYRPAPPPLPSPPCYIGKGLREPCSPYRSTYVFGAELNKPNADNWNCTPQIVDPTTFFDVSYITKNREVVVALYTGSNLYSQTTVVHEWYRKRDNKLLFSYKYSINAPPSGYYYPWYYVYSYIGWVDWEINENGLYYVKITDSAKGFTGVVEFLVAGIIPT